MPGIIARLSSTLAQAAKKQLPAEVLTAVDQQGNSKLPKELWQGLSQNQQKLVQMIRQQANNDGFQNRPAPIAAVQLPNNAQAGAHLAGADPLNAVVTPPGPDPITGNDPQSMHELFGHVVNTDGLAAFEGQALMNELKRRFFATHVTLDYTAARTKLFGEIDNQGGQVRDVYTGRVVATTTIPSSVGAQSMNTEHTWPQSELKAAGKNDAVSDLHHMFAADTEANGRRSNYPFGTPVKVIWQEAGSTLGTDAKGQVVFQPPVEHRGNVARAMFWIATAYDLDIPPAEEAVLRAWDAADPSDDAEEARNEAIKKVQGDLNPYVIDKTLAGRITDF